MLAAMAASGLGVSAFARRHSLTPQRVIFWRERCRSADAVVGVRQQVLPLRLAEEAAPHPALDPVAPPSGVTVSVGAMHFVITRASDPAAVLLLLRSFQACEVREPC